MCWDCCAPRSLSRRRRSTEMFEDNPLEPSPFVFDTSDVFSNLADLDSFNFASPSSSSGHHSPAFSTIPTIAEPQSELNNAWFNFSNINDDALNAKTIASQPIPDTPWDFLTFANDSPDSGATSPFSPTFAIDPQLMATPATSKSSSDFGDDDAAKDEHPREEDDEEDDEEPVTPPPAKHSNKRKSAVLSGGVQKKVHVSSVVKTDPYDNASDDWRPTPDEYQKMSSREKRQLRNKISARNFRNRRKGEYSPFPHICRPFRALLVNRVHYYPRGRRCRTRSAHRCDPNRARLDTIRECCSAAGNKGTQEGTPLQRRTCRLACPSSSEPAAYHPGGFHVSELSVDIAVAHAKHAQGLTHDIPTSRRKGVLGWQQHPIRWHYASAHRHDSRPYRRCRPQASPAREH
jgi:hypothetical protein